MVSFNVVNAVHLEINSMPHKLKQIPELLKTSQNEHVLCAHLINSTLILSGTGERETIWHQKWMNEM
jgi:hypothetical protein